MCRPLSILASSPCARRVGEDPALGELRATEGSQALVVTGWLLQELALGCISWGFPSSVSRYEFKG